MSCFDVSFRLSGDVVPRDHGYSLYSAICGAIPELHEASWLAVHPIAGVTRDGGLLRLRSNAEVRLRVPPERVATLLPLVGTSLDLGRARVSLGVPTIHPVVPAPRLDARLVHVKITTLPLRLLNGKETIDLDRLAESYRTELERQLTRLDIRKPFELAGRNRITVAGKELIGFSVRVSDLSAEESLRLLVNGLGGKRRMGCGVFRPTRVHQ